MYLGALSVNGLTKLTFHGEIIIQNTCQLLGAHNLNKCCVSTKTGPGIV